MRNLTKRAITKIQAIVIVIVIIIAAIVGGYVALTPRAPEKEAEKEVIIAGVLPLTGPYADQGLAEKRGMELAAVHINREGGIKALGGAKVKIVTYDAGGTPAEAASATERLITLYGNKVSAICGAFISPLALSGSEVSERAGIPWLTQAWANLVTERNFKYVFRIVPKGSVVGPITVRHIKEMYEDTAGQPLKKVALVYADNPAAISNFKAMRGELEKLGVQVVMDDRWAAPLADATPLVVKIKDANPQFVIAQYDAVGDGVLIHRKMKELGFSVPLANMGGGASLPEFGENLKELAEGVFVVTDWAPIKGYEWIEEEFVKTYGGTFMNKEAGLYYCMVWIVKEAIEKAGSADPKKIRDALATIVITSGPAASMFYKVAFDENGDTKNPEMVITQWRGGKIVTVAPKKYAIVQPIIQPIVKV